MSIFRRGRTRGDDGVTLVEIMVALTIASAVFLALALAAIAGVKGTLMARQNQLAGDMMNQAIERVRALDFADVAMVTGDSSLATDSRIVSSKFNPGTGVAENLVFAPVGTLNPHTTTETQNGTTYTISRYVTQPAGISSGTRRLTVVVTWPVGGEIKTRSTSTFVTATRRGLPLPRFLLQFSSPSVQTKGTGTDVTYGLRLKNYGARDAWNITGPAGTWTYVVDSDKDGVLDAGETTVLTDSNADGTRDTGTLEVSGEVWILATRTVTGTAGATTAVTWTFKSIAQPLATTASQTLSGSYSIAGTPTPTPTPTPTVTATATPTATANPQTPFPLPVASCATVCTLTTEYLHELPLGSHTLSSSIPGFDTNTTLQSAANNYSTDKTGTAGRYLARGGVLATETSKDRVFDVRKQVSVATTFKAGQAVLYLSVACLTAGSPLTVNVAFGDGINAGLNSFTSRGTGTSTLTVCDGTFREVAVGVPVSAAFSVAKNKYAVIRVVVPSTGASDVRIGYDWAGAQSRMVIPE